MRIKSTKQSEKKINYFLEINNELKSMLLAQINTLQFIMKSYSEKIEPEENKLIYLTKNSCQSVYNILDSTCIIENQLQNKFRLNYKKFEFIDFFKKIIAEYEILLEHNKLELSLELSDEILINADETIIKKAIITILDYTINRAFKNTIFNISCYKIGHELIFKIKSKSAYIDDETMNNILNLNIENTNFKTSTMIELHIAKKIINAHFGRMIFENKHDDTSLIGFHLPLA